MWDTLGGSTVENNVSKQVGTTPEVQQRTTGDYIRRNQRGPHKEGPQRTILGRTKGDHVKRDHRGLH